MHGPGLCTVQATEQNEMPILPLRSLPFSVRKRPITMCTVILKLISPLGEMKISTVSPEKREITEGLPICQKSEETSNLSETWEKENMGCVVGRARNAFS